MRIEHHVGAHGLGEIVGGIRFGIGVPFGKFITFAGSGRRHHFLDGSTGIHHNRRRLRCAVIQVKRDAIHGGPGSVDSNIACDGRRAEVKGGCCIGVGVPAAKAIAFTHRIRGAGSICSRFHHLHGRRRRTRIVQVKGNSVLLRFNGDHVADLEAIIIHIHRLCANGFHIGRTDRHTLCSEGQLLDRAIIIEKIQDAGGHIKGVAENIGGLRLRLDTDVFHGCNALLGLRRTAAAAEQDKAHQRNQRQTQMLQSDFHACLYPLSCTSFGILAINGQECTDHSIQKGSG